MQLKKNGLSTYVFIGPILPYISNWKKIIDETKGYVDCFMFENLNIHGTIHKDVYKWVESYHSENLFKYKSIYKNKAAFWDNMKTEIEQFCIEQNIDFRMYFNHKKQRKIGRAHV